MEKCLHMLPMSKLSGAEKMALTMCKNMKNFIPIVVCGGESLNEVFKRNNIESYTLNFSNKAFFQCINGLKKIIKENNIKIIHAHDNNASVKAYLVKRIYSMNVKIISHIHSCYPFIKENGINKKIDSYFRTKYDYNLACGTIVYDFYNENTNYIQDANTMILSNAIDTKDIITIDKNNIKHEFKIDKEKFVLGIVGRICNIKGIIPFINEFEKNKIKLKDCVVLIVGSGDEEEDVKKLICELNLNEFFILTGFQDNPYRFYPIIDLFLLPSLYEGLPMVLLEAMLYKKAIISMNVGGISEVIKDHDTGILVNPNDLKGFFEQIISIKENDIERVKLGKSACEFVNKNYDIESYIKKLENKYTEIL